MYGMHPQKGTISIGADADLVLWDPKLVKTVTWEDLHDIVGYTPYEGMILKDCPVKALSSGRVVVDRDDLLDEQGSGRFLERKTTDAAMPSGRMLPEMDPKRNFGADVLPEAKC